MIVMMRAEEPVRLGHEVAMSLQLLRGHPQVLRRIGEYVEVHGHRRAGVEVDPIEIKTRVQR